MTTNRFRRCARWFAVPAIAAILVGGCGDDDSDGATGTTDVVDDLTDDLADGANDASEDLAETAEGAQGELEAALRNAGLTNLASAVEQVDLSEQLEGNEFTVFAPNDDAFLDLDSDDLTDLLADPEQILDLLQDHLVVGEQITADDLDDADSVTAESGRALRIDASGDAATVDGASIVSTETVGDGVIHVIDAVLMAEATS